MTDQLSLWTSDFGSDYASRNQITEQGLRQLFRTWGRILERAISPTPVSVLEVGCNIGRNLVVLSQMMQKVHAIEPNADAVAAARMHPILTGADIRLGTAFEIPFEDESVDLVFTSGVLIHVAPADLPRAVDEIFRVARHYVLCIEYFSHEPVEVPYRGLRGHLFKRDFGQYYLDRFPRLDVLDYGFFWKPVDASDNLNWWLFRKTGSPRS